MALIKRGGVWHYDFSVDGRRYRGTTGFRRKADAAEFEERARKAAKLGAPRETPTLEDAADRWFAARVVGRKSETITFQRLKIALRLLGPETLVRDIGAREVAEAIAVRRLEPTRQTAKWKEPRPPANATVNRDLIDSTLRPILSYAQSVLEVEVRPIAWEQLRLPEPRERDRAFTPAEIAAWREHLPEWHQPVFDFIATYGVRLKEAFFPPEAVDLRSGRIRIRERKNGKAHTLPLLPADRAAMAARVGRAVAAGLQTVWFSEVERPDPEAPGCTRLVLEPIHWRGFQSASRAALDAAKISDARPVHDLRHHAATAVMRGSGNLAAVKRLLGHESIASTMRYAHADDDDVLTALRHTHDTKAGQAGEKFKQVRRLRTGSAGT